MKIQTTDKNLIQMIQLAEIRQQKRSFIINQDSSYAQLDQEFLQKII